MSGLHLSDAHTNSGKLTVAHPDARPAFYAPLQASTTTCSSSAQEIVHQRLPCSPGHAATSTPSLKGRGDSSDQTPRCCPCALMKS